MAKANIRRTSLLLIALLVVSGFFVAHQVHAATLFSDGFGTGGTDTTFNESPTWTEGGDGATKQASGSGNDTASPNGDRFALVEGQDGYICTTITSTGYNNVQLSYYWRGDSNAESDDDGIVEFKSAAGNSCTNSSGWTNLQDYNLSIDSSWSTQSAFTNAGFNNTSFLIRFRTNASSGSEDFRVDGVLVTGDAITSTATLTLVKAVTLDNGGTALNTAWTLEADGPTDISGASGSAAVTNATVNTGSYTLSETGGPSGYTAGTYSCVKNAGSPIVSNTISLASGDTATCTITNNDNAPSLTLNKIVVNDNGGTTAESAWTITATGPTTLSGQGAVGSADVVSNSSFSAGTYTLSESGPAGYTASLWSCTNGVVVNGSNQLTLGVGQTTVCSITNDDKAPKLHLRKVVTNDNGGTATNTGWTLTATGLLASNNLSGTTPVDSTGTLKADTWALSETGGPSGYTASAWICLGGSMPDATHITLGLDEEATCTITNDDVAPTLKLVKMVSGGENLPGEWMLTATGTELGFSDEGDSNEAHTVKANVAYALSESGPSGYSASSWGCDGGLQAGSQITLQPGQNVTCTITNTYVTPGTIVIVKNTLGGNDLFNFSGSEGIGDFQISTSAGSGSQPFSGLTPGSYSVSEENIPEGWTLTSSSCEDENEQVMSPSSINLNEGGTVTCTFTNTKDGNIVVKKVTDPVGDENSFTFYPNYNGEVSFMLSDGQENDSGNLTPNQNYSVTESTPDGYVTSMSCDNGDNPSYIYLEPGETVTCTFVNHKKPTLTIKKITDGDDGVFYFNIEGTEETEYENSISLETEEGMDESEPMVLDAGEYEVTEYNLAEGWTLADVSCEYDGESEGYSIAGGEEVELDYGANVICTFTNSKKATLKIQKVILNLDIGTKTAADFSFKVNNGEPTAFEADAENVMIVDPGAYNVVEVADGQYTASYNNCSVELAAGQTATCIVTNTWGTIVGGSGGGGGGGGSGVITYTITASTGGNGMISPFGGTSVVSGNNQTYTMTADANFHVGDVLVDGVSVGAVTTYTFTNVLANHTIAVTYAAGAETGNPNNSGSFNRSDLNKDGTVDLLDLSLLMNDWGKTGQNILGDINKDGAVDDLDFSIMMSDWS